MPQIVAIKELKNTNRISQMCHESQEPIYVTKNGYGDMVIMSMEAYEEGRYESEVYNKLREAEIQAESSAKRFSHGEVMEALRLRLKEAEGGKRA